jgi:hypothetical protein
MDPLATMFSLANASFRDTVDPKGAPLALPARTRPLSSSVSLSSITAGSKVYFPALPHIPLTSLSPPKPTISALSTKLNCHNYITRRYSFHLNRARSAHQGGHNVYYS